MDKRSVVCLGIPHRGDIPGYFLDSVIAVVGQSLATVGLMQSRAEGTRVDLARNLIVRDFLANPAATHLFFMDSDQTFPAGALTRLLSREKDIVGGTYFQRTETPLPHIYRFERDAPENADGTGPSRRWYRPVAKEFAAWWKSHPEAGHQPNANVYLDTPDSLVRCDVLATGCMLISRRVFEALPDPWFRCWEGTAGGEDFDFCEDARRAGFEVWGDFSVQCGHEIHPVFLGAEDFVDVYGIGTDKEHDFVRPILVKGGPNGREVQLGVYGPEPTESEVA